MAAKLDDHGLVEILEAAPDAMVCVAADGRIVVVNAQTERTFGCPRDQLVGKLVESLVPEAARRILDRHGCRVLVAGGGHEALAALAAQPGPIDMLLTDVAMPQMMGQDLAERVRALQPGVRVLFVSGYTQGAFGDQGTCNPE